jgi:hypothetical protein
MQTDLQTETDLDIVADNLNAVGAIYFATCWRSWVFRVVERIVELYAQGLLPLRRGRAACLDRYARRRADDGTEARGFRGRWASGSRRLPAAEPRLLVAVDAFVVGCRCLFGGRRSRLCSQPRGRCQPAIRARARSQPSAHGGSTVTPACFGSAVGRAAEQAELLAVGAAMWQVIDRVNRGELGGAHHVARYRTQAGGDSVRGGWWRTQLN